MNVELNKKDRKLAKKIQFAEHLEGIDNIKLGIGLMLIGGGVTLLATETTRRAAIKFINNSYDKLRAIYDIPNEACIHVGRRYIVIK